MTHARLRSLAREAKVDIVGGNVTRADKLGITMALLGEARGGILRRDTARPGDEIFVTGGTSRLPILKKAVRERFPGSTEADSDGGGPRGWLAVGGEGAPTGPDPAVEALLRDQARGWWRSRRKIRLTHDAGPPTDDRKKGARKKDRRDE